MPTPDVVVVESYHNSHKSETQLGYAARITIRRGMNRKIKVCWNKAMVMCSAVLVYPALMCEVLVCVDDSLVSHFRMQNSFPPFLTLRALLVPIFAKLKGFFYAHCIPHSITNV
jgi:hypothetical protein